MTNYPYRESESVDSPNGQPTFNGAQSVRELAPPPPSELPPTQEQITTILNDITPPKSLDQWQDLARQQQHWPDPDQTAADYLEGDDTRRSNLVSTLAATPMSADQVRQYLEAAVPLAQALSQSVADNLYILNELAATGTTSPAILQNFHDFGQRWHDAFLADVGQEIAEDRIRDFIDLTNMFSEEEGEDADSRAKRLESYFDFLTTLYYRAYTIDDPDALRVCSNFCLSNMGAELTPEAIESALNTMDIAEIATPYKQYQNEIVENFMNGLFGYENYFRVSKAAVQALTKRLLPAMLHQDPQVAILTAGQNEEHITDPGIFIVRAYATPVTPSGVNELITNYRRVPTTNLYHKEQNRVDARTIGGAFGELREVIHEQEPQGHAIVSAMITFYDTGDPTSLEEFRAVVGEDGFTRQLYDQPIPKVVNDPMSDEPQQYDGTVTPIAVLRDLEAHTRPVDIEPPQTSDQHLNQLLQQVYTARSRQKIEALERVLAYVSRLLISDMQEHVVGIEPNHVAAYAWLDLAGFETLKNLSYEDQIIAYKQPWFTELLRYNLLTSSAVPLES